jgi:signal transduction histidine kinase
MPPIDSRSILLLANFAAIFCLLTLIILRHSFPKTIGGLAQWSWACGVTVIATTLLSARDFIPRFLSVVLGNALVTVFILLMYDSLKRFSGRAASIRNMSLVVVLMASLWAWVAFNPNYPRWGILLGSFANMCLFGACAVAAAQIEQQSIAKRFTFAVFVLATVILGVRFVTVLAYIDTPTHLYDVSFLQKMYLAAYPLTFLAATFGFMLLVNEKLRGILLNSNRVLEDAVVRRTADLQLEIRRTRELERINESIADNERRRIGRELHDDLGQKMTGISLAAEALALALHEVAPRLAVQADGIERAASDAIAKVRDISHGLMPVESGAQGLLDALAELAASVSMLSNVACSFDYHEPVNVEDESVATNLFRISQESISNAIRHAQATQVQLRLDYVDGKVSLSIKDNGIGFDASAFSAKHPGYERGAGLSIMRYRASVIHYTLAIESHVGRGTSIRVTEN